VDIIGGASRRGGSRSAGPWNSLSPFPSEHGTIYSKGLRIFGKSRPFTDYGPVLFGSHISTLVGARSGEVLKGKLKGNVASIQGSVAKRRTLVESPSPGRFGADSVLAAIKVDGPPTVAQKLVYVV
jgi:hypothetical protein